MNSSQNETLNTFDSTSIRIRDTVNNVAQGNLQNILIVQSVLI